ncbi:VOC family protein [Shinella curvata]|uniref:VOC family protein n=1 Tax=Shinella curvata TaxID=1817964 RepID=A0ABT8XH04_9HYPH|nr:VOC family protein [Shinella curvata]MCJ8053683.1 VOC family protein [Shinella curvata]MDO6123015.1 VOC family protein [Shinella curvata]
MSNEISIEISLFVEHGREQEAADFYVAAFGAEVIEPYRLDGVLMGFAMRFGATPVAVAGSNPRREQNPSYGGPFFPKVAGSVSAIFTLNVGDIEHAVQRASRSGAVIRDAVQRDVLDRRVASLFDPFGHIWALVERKAESLDLAA